MSKKKPNEARQVERVVSLPLVVHLDLTPKQIKLLQPLFDIQTVEGQKGKTGAILGQPRQLKMQFSCAYVGQPYCEQIAAISRKAGTLTKRTS